MQVDVQVVGAATYVSSRQGDELPRMAVGFDPRADPVAKAAVLVVRAALAPVPERIHDALAVLAVSQDGCGTLVARVLDGLQYGLAKPGYFARCGPQMIAAYVAIALRTH